MRFFENESKNCPFCQKGNICKNGVRNKIQRYLCKDCNKSFTLQRKLEINKIWLDYTFGKQTYKQLAEKYQCSIRTIQRYIQHPPLSTLNLPSNQKLNLIIDTTFFKRDFGVMVIMDNDSGKVISYRIVSSEKDIYYKLAINRLVEKGYKIQSITCDGRRGMLKNKLNIPTQLCQFHQVAIVMRTLRKRHQSLAGNELKKLVLSLKSSRKNEFYRELHYWKIKHETYLNERSDKPNEKGKYPYKHRNVRSAYASLRRHMDYLFTFEKYPELNIPNTTNKLEGFFKRVKDHLRLHNGLSRKRKIMFIKDFLNKNS